MVTRPLLFLRSAATATRAPSRPRAIAIARPIPEDAPTTRVRRSASRFIRALSSAGTAGLNQDSIGAASANHAPTRGFPVARPNSRMTSTRAKVSTSARYRAAITERSWSLRNGKAHGLEPMCFAHCSLASVGVGVCVAKIRELQTENKQGGVGAKIARVDSS